MRAEVARAIPALGRGARRAAGRGAGRARRSAVVSETTGAAGTGARLRAGAMRGVRAVAVGREVFVRKAFRVGGAGVASRAVGAGARPGNARGRWPGTGFALATRKERREGGAGRSASAGAAGAAIRGVERGATGRSTEARATRSIRGTGTFGVGRDLATSIAILGRVISSGRSRRVRSLRSGFAMRGVSILAICGITGRGRAFGFGLGRATGGGGGAGLGISAICGGGGFGATGFGGSGFAISIGSGIAGAGGTTGSGRSSGMTSAESNNTTSIGDSSVRSRVKVTMNAVRSNTPNIIAGVCPTSRRIVATGPPAKSSPTR